MKKTLFEGFLKDSVKASKQALNEESLADALAAEGDPDTELDAPDSDLVDALDAEEVQTPDNSGALENAKEVQQTIKNYQSENNEIIMGWIKKLDELVEFMNSPTHEGGIKATIDKAIQGSVFEKIKTSEARSLTRSSKEVAALSQSLRSYVNANTTEIKPK